VHISPARAREGLSPEDRPRAREDPRRDLRRVRAVWRGHFHETPRSAPGDHPLHSLQRGPGAHREGVRLIRATLRRASGHGSGTLVATALLFCSLCGCASVFAEDGTSASLGTTSEGALREPVMLPVSGDGYIVPSHWR